MKKYAWILALVAIVLMSLACQTLTGGGKGPDLQSAPPLNDNGSENPSQPGGSGSNENSGGTDVDSKLFPMPPDAENVIDMGQDTVLFQTGITLDEAMNFYRDAYGKQGYTERDLLTVTSDQTFSMVFDGHSSGKAIVVQGVDLGDGKINITITLEDV